MQVIAATASFRNRLGTVTSTRNFDVVTYPMLMLHLNCNTLLEILLQYVPNPMHEMPCRIVSRVAFLSAPLDMFR